MAEGPVAPQYGCYAPLRWVDKLVKRAESTPSSVQNGRYGVSGKLLTLM